MHEIAVTASRADGLVVLSAASFSEVGDWRELADEGPPGVEPAPQSLQGFVGVLLVCELDVDVADHVVAQIFANVQLFDLAVLGQLFEHFLVKVVELFLDLLLVELRRISSGRGDLRRRILVHVLNDHRLRKRRLVVLPRATIAVATGANLEKEGTVHLVFLGPVNSREVRGAAARAAQLAVSPVTSRVAMVVITTAAATTIVRHR